MLREWTLIYIDNLKENNNYAVYYNIHTYKH